MYDRDEFLKARIDNRLNERHVRIMRMNGDFGAIAIREVMQNGITIGSFAGSRREYKKCERDYFIESAPNEAGVARQLWLPATRWVGIGTVRQREVIATAAEPSQRFDAWENAQHLIDDTEGYSQYEGEGQALYEEAKLTLQYADANDDNFSVTVKTISF